MMRFWIFVGESNCSLRGRHEVLRQVIIGLLNKQIAWNLDIAEKTVKIHRGRIMEKLRVQSVADLVRLAEKAGVKPADREVR